MTRRAQWISFYTAALMGSGGPATTSIVLATDADDAAEGAARIADAAMARLDARAFPKPKIASLLEAANAVYGSAVTASGGHLVRDDFMAALGKAITDFEEQS